MISPEGRAWLDKRTNMNVNVIIPLKGIGDIVTVDGKYEAVSI